MCSRVPETKASESDADDEPGRKEDPPRRGARLAGEMEDDPEAAGTDQEEAAGAEPPSAQLELAILNGLTFRPSRRSVICLRGPGPRFTSRGRRSGGADHPGVETKGVPGHGVPPGWTRG